VGISDNDDAGSTSVEVKIGVQYAPRELSLDSSQTPDEVAKAVADALKADLGVLTLVDEKGRRVLVPADKIAYVEIAENEQRRVGFGAL
jgi:Protein of unknown function (DUF3107)